MTGVTPFPPSPIDTGGLSPNTKTFGAWRASQVPNMDILQQLHQHFLERPVDSYVVQSGLIQNTDTVQYTDLLKGAAVHELRVINMAVATDNQALFVELGHGSPATWIGANYEWSLHGHHNAGAGLEFSKPTPGPLDTVWRLNDGLNMSNRPGATANLRFWVTPPGGQTRAGAFWELDIETVAGPRYGLWGHGSLPLGVESYSSLRFRTTGANMSAYVSLIRHYAGSD